LGLYTSRPAFCESKISVGWRFNTLHLEKMETNGANGPVTKKLLLKPSVSLFVQMPGVNGIDFQKALIQRRREEQLVFMTGYGNITMCVQVMKAGAVDFLPKPFKSRELLKCVEHALDRSAEQRRRAAERNEARRLPDLLTPREFEVMQLVITGMLNKQIGGELGVAEKTVKVHRGRLMQKLGVTSVAELVQLVQRAGVPPNIKPGH
jgi:FixJ family two-component response regulator